MIVTIHQPEHLPWLGFFDKVRQADCLVILDDVQYRKRYFQNRNRVRSVDGFIWLTVPVQVKGRFDQLISQVRIDNEGHPRWREKCWKSIVQCYRKAPHFRDHAPFFEALYAREWDSLLELNEAIIRCLLSALGIDVEMVRSSTLRLAGKKGELMLEICERVGARVYLSGISGKEYLDAERFNERGIALRFQEFHHPVYRQLYEPFLPAMSVIDLLFNHGPKSLDIIKGVGVPTLEKVFV